MKVRQPPLQCPCNASHFDRVFTYTAAPKDEVHFTFSSAQEYLREVFRCRLCGHFVSVHDMDADALYAGEYVNSTYGVDGIRRTFERIIGLDPSQSDNVGRVQRIEAFARLHFPSHTTGERGRTILDVGSGLCVFLHRMKAVGWDCTALDPDSRAAQHAREIVGVAAVCGDFMTLNELGRFDVVTFNKVLEHVKDPVQMLAKALTHVKPGGVVYVEVPDGEAACHDGADREEFTIDHSHVFSPQSLAALAHRSGFQLHTLERLREPSTKYTLRAFLVPDLSPSPF